MASKRKKKNAAAKRKQQQHLQAGTKSPLQASSLPEASTADSAPPPIPAEPVTTDDPKPTVQEQKVQSGKLSAKAKKEKNKVPPRKVREELAMQKKLRRRKLHRCAICAVCIGLIGGIAATEVFWASKSDEERVVSGMREVKDTAVQYNKTAMTILKAAASVPSSGSIRASVYQGTRSTATQFEKPLLVVLDLDTVADELCEADLPRLSYDAEANEFAYHLESEEMTVQAAMREAISEALRSSIGSSATKTYQVTETMDGLIVLVSNTTDDIVAQFAYIMEQNPDLKTEQQLDILKETLALEEVEEINEGGEGV